MVQRKIFFVLERDDDDYPPADVESVWVEDRGDGTFAIDNIPFFTRQATLGDVVDARESDNVLYYRSTLLPSENSLLRISFFEIDVRSAVLDSLEKLGCSFEKSHIECLVAINVPISVDIERVRSFLNGEFQKDVLDYEEALLRQ